MRFMDAGAKTGKPRPCGGGTKLVVSRRNTIAA
jgi:hypothetical protein